MGGARLGSESISLSGMQAKHLLKLGPAGVRSGFDKLTMMNAMSTNAAGYGLSLVHCSASTHRSIA